MEASAPPRKRRLIRPIKCLFIDAATRVGWCAGAGDRLPKTGYIDLPRPVDGYRGEMFLELRLFLIRMITEMQADGSEVVLGFEQPLLPKPFLKKGRIIYPTNIDTTLTLQGLVAIVQAVAAEMGIRYRRHDVGTIKKELAGFGGAEKKDMVFVARKIGLTIEVHDEADALGGFLLMLREFNKDASRRFDALIWGARGALI